MPNFSSGLFNITVSDFLTSNPYSPLSEGGRSSISNRSGSPGTPLATSSPVTGKKVNKTPFIKKKPLKILNVNCQSVIPKKGEFQNLVDSTNPDIVVATETWLEDGVHLDGEIGEVNKFSSQYKIYRRDRKDGYGGVFVAVSRNIISARADELETDAEIVWVRINIKGSKTLYVSGFYRPQESDDKGHKEFKTSVARIAAYPNANIWIAGDLNFPGIDWVSKILKPSCRYPTLHQDLLDTLDDNALQQLVNEPTREQNTLDLFITNNTTLINKVQVIPGISDHHAVLVEADLTPMSNKQQKRQVPLYKKANWEQLKEHVRNYGNNLDTTEKTVSVDTLWQNFKIMLEAGVKQHVPHKTAKTKDSLPWITRSIKRLIRRRDAIYIKNKQSGTGKYLKTFKDLKSQVQKQLRQAYWSYVQDMVCPEPGNTHKGSKKFWTYIKHCKQDSSGVAPLLGDDGIRTDNAVSKAEILNKQFTSVFSQISPLTLVQSSTQVLRKYLSSRVNQITSMPDLTITVNGVAKLLKNLKPQKAAGPDSIKPIILKELYQEISPILTFIFQRSKDTGEIPEEWKQANVVPVFKKGPKHLAANYRPVSLTCICSKLMEHILSTSIMQHLDDNNILYGKQHGFRARHSCEYQLLELVEDLHRNMETGQQTDIIVMDFAKAFDKVSHTRLLYKLEGYGIGGLALQWVKNWLTNRKQQVVVEGEKSKETYVTSGVPQGSVLGPILFLIYINDLPERVQSQVRIFADDTILYRPISTPQDAVALQKDLNHLVDWEQEWLMEFHPLKCQVIRVTRSKTPLATNYLVHNHQLEVVPSAKYLGITISEDLTWNKHISQVSSKASRTLGLVKRNLKISSPKIKEQAFNALVKPTVEYSAAVWDPYTQANVHRIEMIQRRAARWTLNRYHNTSSVTGMLNHLKWPTLQSRRSEARLCLMYKMVHNLVATNIGLYAVPVSRATRKTHPHSFIMFIQIQAGTEAYRMSYFPKTIVEWILLPAEVVMAPSLDAFRGCLQGSSSRSEGFPSLNTS
jgi:hypothetical protein